MGKRKAGESPNWDGYEGYEDWKNDKRFDCLAQAHPDCRGSWQGPICSPCRDFVDDETGQMIKIAWNNQFPDKSEPYVYRLAWHS